MNNNTLNFKNCVYFKEITRLVIYTRLMYLYYEIIYLVTINRFNDLFYSTARDMSTYVLMPYGFFNITHPGLNLIARAFQFIRRINLSTESFNANLSQRTFKFKQSL